MYNTKALLALPLCAYTTQAACIHGKNYVFIACTQPATDSATRTRLKGMSLTTAADGVSNESVFFVNVVFF